MYSGEKVSKRYEEQNSSVVHFIQGPCPRVISKPHKFFFLRRLLFSEAKILCMKCQLNSKTDTMKILATEHMWCYANQHSFCLRVHHILYVSVTFAGEQSGRQCPRTHRTQSSRTRAALPKVKAIFSRRTAQPCLPFTVPRMFNRKTAGSSVGTISDLPFAVPKYTT